MRNKLSETTNDRIFNAVNYSILLLLCFLCLYPMYYVAVASVTSNAALQATPGFLWYPKGFTLGSFRLAFSHPLLLSGYRNILFVLIVSLPINILLTLLAAYFMASKNVFFKRPILFVILFTMFFNGGMIPTYLNIRQLGLYNSLWALILPAAMSVYNAIIYKTAIEAIPDSLMESAYIDGASDFTVLFRIVFPLIKPTTAVLLLYYGIGHWNS